MKIIITESQYRQIIFESSLEQFKNVFTSDTQITLSQEVPDEIKKIGLPKISNADNLFMELGNKGFEFSNTNFVKGQQKPFSPLEMFGTFKGGNTYKLTFQPYNRQSNSTLIKLTFTLSGNNRKAPKIREI